MYVLVSGGHEIASLRWVRSKLPHAVGEIASGRWTFHSSRLLYPCVSIKSPELNRLEAIIEVAMKGHGRLSFIDDRCFHWLSTDFWHNEWVFTDAQGERLIQFIPEQRLFKIGATLNLEQHVLSLSELPFLAITGWYLLANINEQDSNLSSLARAVRVKG